VEPIPDWFVREMKRTIDHRYRVEVDEATKIYKIVMDSDVVVESPMRGAFRITGPKTVDVFTHLNADALMHLRYRKWLGRQMKIIENPQREFAFLMAQEKAAKAKEMNLAHEMMAEGLQEGYRIDRKHSVS
jgi:hypothetical protein